MRKHVSDINECLGVTCENGGTCDDVINDYNCICVVGYTGRHCQTSELKMEVV